MENQYLISFRYTADLYDPQIFYQFLLDEGIDISASSCGLHEEECAQRHYHLHFLTSNTFKFKSPPLIKLKNNNKYIEKLLKDNPRSLSVKSTHNQTDPSANLEEDVMTSRRFLNYPLKENKPFVKYCINIDLSSQILEANAEWKARKVWKQKQAERKAREEAKRGLLWTHLDSLDITKSSGIYVVVESTLKFYKGNQDAPHPQYQVKSAELYAYHKGIWSIEDIISRYIPQNVIKEHNQIMDALTYKPINAFNLEY